MDFLTYVGMNYDRIVSDCKRNLRMLGKSFDYDLFADTILKCQEKLKGKEICEYEPYLWVALRNNALRENVYVNVELNEQIDVESECYNDIVDKVELCIKQEFGNEWYELYLKHANGMKYDDFDNKLGNVKYQFRKIREFVRKKFAY